MPSRRAPAAAPEGEVGRIVDIDVGEEMRTSFLEYAYSVIYARALPDARDGLKPVQRRILYQMSQLGLRPDRGHVKSARVVGEVMGRLHPHGDSAIYDALVRMAQPFVMRLPLIDGHGNFGSPDDGPAAMRYTECRLAPAAMLMTESLDEQVVDMVANYDGREQEPIVLPAAYPCLLVNGASGIAVGMATTMAPHNLGEVIAAARLRLSQPRCELAQVMAVLPGPDLPTGGIISGQAGVIDAYAHGRGTFRIRARIHVEQVTARRAALVVTEMPFNVGPERVIARIRDLVTARTVTFVSDLTDLTDMAQGTRLVIGLKSGTDPEVALATLYRLTALEESFSINAVAIVDGQPRTLGLLELLDVYLDHRLTITRRRTQHRLERASARRHLLTGLLRAIIDIDEVIALVRTSDTTAIARDRLMAALGLTIEQVEYILEMPLRRLTRFSRIELETEAADLDERIAGLSAILADEDRLRGLVSDELAAVAAAHPTPRRTVLVEQEVGALAPPPTERPGGTGEPLTGVWTVCLAASGQLARARCEGATAGSRDGPATPVADDPTRPSGGDLPPDALIGVVRVPASAAVLLCSDQGEVLPLQLAAIPVDSPGRARAGHPAAQLVGLPPGAAPVGLLPDSGDGEAVLVTAHGMVKRVRLADRPTGGGRWTLLPLDAGDRVVAVHAVPAVAGGLDVDLVCVSRHGAAIRLAGGLRPLGRSARPIAGMRLAAGDAVIAAGLLSEGVIVTVAALAGALPGADAGSVKVTPLADLPRRGRGTGGVRLMRLRRGEDGLCTAVAAAHPVALSGHGEVIALPPPTPRGGSGATTSAPIAVLGFAAP